MKGEKKIKPSLKSEVAMTFYKSLRISLGQLLTCAEDAPAHSNKCIFQSNFPMRFLIESIVKEKIFFTLLQEIPIVSTLDSSYSEHG